MTTYDNESEADYRTLRTDDNFSPSATAFITHIQKVPRPVYDYCRAHCRAAYEDGPHRPFLFQGLNFIITPTRTDDLTGGKIIPAPLCAMWAGKKYDRHFRAWKWLKVLTDAFGETLTLRVHKWDFQAGRARSLTLTLPDELATAYSQGSGQWCYMDGTSISQRRQKQEREYFRAHRQTLTEAAPPDAMQRPLLALTNGHLNNRQQTIRTAFRAGIECPAFQKWLTAWQTQSLPKNPAKQSGMMLHREMVGAWMDTIRAGHDPEWAYAQSIKTPAKPIPTPRCHAVGVSAVLQPRAGRNALLSPFTTMDLVASQPSILSVQWGAARLETLLRECMASQHLPDAPSFWGQLLAQVGLPAECKPALKEGVCCMAYGMAEAYLPSHIARALRDGEDAAGGLTAAAAKDAARVIMQSDFAQELLECRQQQMQAIVRDGGIWMPDWEYGGVTHRGRFCTLEPTADAKTQAAQVRTLLAVSMQARELAVMLAAVEAIEATPNVTCLLWLHDGFTICHRAEAKRLQETTRIEKAVNDRCAKLGIPTYLKVTPPA